MSNKYYKEKWEEAIGMLNEQVQLENLPAQEYEQTKKNFSIDDLFRHSANLYIRYIDCYKKLEDCYDQIVQPQKKRLLKDMLENTLLRIIELKHDLISYHTENTNAIQGDFINLDEMLIDLKLNPDAIEIPIPRYFKEDDKDTLNERNLKLNKLLKDLCQTDEPEIEVEEQYPDILKNENEALWIIQKMERGRQGIVRGLKAKAAKKSELKKLEKQKAISEGKEISEEQERQDAVMVFQKYFRGYCDRRTVYKMKEEELEFLGMKMTPVQTIENKDSSAFGVQDVRLKRKMIQEKNESEYKEALDKIKDQMLKQEGPDIKEKKLQELRDQIIQYNEIYEKFPKDAQELYEMKDKILPLTPEEIEARKAEEEQKKKEKDKAKKQAAKNSNKKTKKEPDDPMKNKSLKGPTERLIKINDKIEQYIKEWESKDESDNFAQKYDYEYAKNVVRPSVEDEIKKNVDEMINCELKLLKKTKPKPTKPSKPEKPKKVKIPGQATGGNRPPLDQLAELVEAKVVKKLETQKLSDFVGDFNLMGSALEKVDQQMADPSMAQLRQVILEFIAAPLGSSNIRKSLDKKILTCLFFGPSGTGKTMMVRTLAHECNALVIDLSPQNIEDIYQDSKGAEKLLYFAFNVARNFQPAIIYIDEINLVFPGGKKKVSSKTGPARIKNHLLKQLKCHKENFIDDRVIVIACTNKSKECNAKDIKSVFNKHLFFPIPDYGTRILQFKTLVERAGGALTDTFPLGTLGYMTEGYTAGSFRKAIDKILTKRRKEQLKERPLKIEEFIGPIASIHVDYKELYQEFKDFNYEVTGMKERKLKRDNPEDDGKKGGKGGKGGKATKKTKK